MKKSLKRIVSASLGTMLMVGALTGCGGGDKKAEAPKKAPSATTDKIKINFPTASASGALYAVGAAITNNWNKTDGEAQVSIAISSNAYQCMNGTDSFKGHAYKDLKAIAGLYLNPNQVVVTNKSGITKLEDVKGKHFAVASAGSSVYNECQTHFTAAGIKFPDEIKAEYIAFGGAADMLQNGTIDGAWIMSGTPASAVSQALSSNCRLVNISDDIIKKLQEKYPWYVKYTIPAGTYPNQKEAVNTSAIKMVMFCRHDLKDETVYQMTKSFWEHIDELGQAQKNLKGLKPAEAVKDIAKIPLHPGAEKYYKEIGVLK